MFNSRQSFGVGYPGHVRRQSHEGGSQGLERRQVIFALKLGQYLSNVCGGLSFLKLRHSFQKPDWGPTAWEGRDEGMRQLMEENRPKSVCDASQSPGRNANFAVEQRTGPTGCLRNVEVSLIRVKNHRHSGGR